MTYYGAKQLSEAFRTVRENTIKIAEEIPAESYSYRPTPDSRSVAELLIHIVASTRFPETIHFKQRLNSLRRLRFLHLNGRSARRREEALFQRRNPRNAQVEPGQLLSASGQL